MAKQELTAAEAVVMGNFTAAPYRAFGCCANPRCESPRAVVLTCGRNSGSRICLICFEFDFDCTHPNLRRRRGSCT